MRQALGPGPLEHAQPVLVRNLSQARVLVATPAQGVDEVGQASRIADGGGYRGTVEVRADAYPVDAEMLDQMVDVGDDVVEGGVGITPPVRAQESRREIDSGEAPRFPDGRKLPVREVARMGADCMRVGVAGDERRVRHPRHVPEALLGEVGQIDEYLQLIAAPDELAPELRQPAADIGPRREAER